MTVSEIRPQIIVYPESDGEPVGETDDHRDLMFELNLCPEKPAP